MVWRVDKAASKVGFSIKHLVVSTVKGFFADFDCDLDLHPDNLAASTARAELKVASVTTKDKTRDDFLVSEEFLNPARYPTIVFQSTEVRSAGREFTLVGMLKIRDIEQLVTLTGKLKAPERSPHGARRLSFSLGGAIQRADFDLGFNPALDAGNVLVGAKIKLFVDIELVESQAH